MTSNFTIPDELKDVWRARFTTGSLKHDRFVPKIASQEPSNTTQATPKIASPLPIPIWLEDIWRARLRTKSLGHGDFAHEFASQQDYGRVQATNILQDKIIPEIISKAGSLPVNITTAVAGTAFINMFVNGAHNNTLAQIPPYKKVVQGFEESQTKEDVDVAIQNVVVHTSKYTAEECAQRKALKRERRAQQKQQRELLSSALPVPAEADGMEEKIREVPSPSLVPSLVKNTSKQIRNSSSPMKRWPRPTEQPVAPIINGNDVVLSPMRSCLTLHVDDDDLVGPEVLVLWPTFLGYLVIIICLILWATVGTLSALLGAWSSVASLGSGPQRKDLVLLVGTGDHWYPARKDLVYQNFTTSLSTYHGLGAMNDVFVEYSVLKRPSLLEKSKF